jgi:hypothetical protein
MMLLYILNKFINKNFSSKNCPSLLSPSSKKCSKTAIFWDTFLNQKYFLVPATLNCLNTNLFKKLGSYLNYKSFEFALKGLLSIRISCADYTFCVNCFFVFYGAPKSIFSFVLYSIWVWRRETNPNPTVPTYLGFLTAESPPHLGFLTARCPSHTSLLKGLCHQFRIDWKWYHWIGLG